MIISGKHFEYGGTHSTQYDLCFAHIDTSPLKQSSGNITYKTLFSSKQKRNYITGVDWGSSPLSFEAEILRRDPIGRFEANEIENWLFNSNGYQKLYCELYEDEETERVNGLIVRSYIECVF